jgi:hypothetical protein
MNMEMHGGLQKIKGNSPKVSGSQEQPTRKRGNRQYGNNAAAVGNIGTIG